MVFAAFRAGAAGVLEDAEAETPLREMLAAALEAMSGWHGR